MSARTENALTLAAIAGIPTEEASSLLEAAIVITAAAIDYDQWFAQTLQAIVERTFDHCRLQPATGDEILEVIIGKAEPRLETARLWVSVESARLTIRSGESDDRSFERLPAALAVVAACYVASAVAKAVLPGTLPSVDDPNIVDLREIPVPPFDQPVVLRNVYLAGAGAIGNAFLWTLRHFEARGVLNIHDPDSVSEGNLNRQIYFGPDDVGHNKAMKLAEHAQPDFRYLKLRPHPTSLQAAIQKTSDHRWLENVVVGVDSRRARRHIQSELPKRVFDASTTGIEEVVLFFSEEPNREACLGCVYHETPDEHAREKHVANALGVSMEELQQNWISPDAARRIAQKYPSLNVEEITGEAYDSLFKALCGQQLLQHNGRQILAPFAFVSILAGALLAIEFVRRTLDPALKEFNLWKISPWSRPMLKLQRLRTPFAGCEFCNDQIYLEVRKELWG